MLYLLDLVLHGRELYEISIEVSNFSLAVKDHLYERLVSVIKKDPEQPRFLNYILNKLYGEESGRIISVMLQAKRCNLELTNDIYIYVAMVEKDEPLLLRVNGLLNQLNQDPHVHMNQVHQFPHVHARVLHFMVKHNLGVNNPNLNTDNYFKFLCKCYPEIQSPYIRTIVERMNSFTHNDLQILENKLVSIIQENDFTGNEEEVNPASFPWGKVAVATVAVVVGGLAIASGLGWVSLGIIV